MNTIFGANEGQCVFYCAVWRFLSPVEKCGRYLNCVRHVALFPPRVCYSFNLFSLLFSLLLRRSKDPQERIQADLALKNFGSDALSIHLAIARSSMEVRTLVLSCFSLRLPLARVAHTI